MFWLRGILTQYQRVTLTPYNRTIPHLFLSLYEPGVSTGQAIVQILMTALERVFVHTHTPVCSPSKDRVTFSPTLFTVPYPHGFGGHFPGCSGFII